MPYQNQWDTANALLRGRFIAMSAYIKMNKIMMHLSLLEKNKNKSNPKLIGRNK
jgi:hypothetical protein